MGRLGPVYEDWIELYAVAMHNHAGVCGCECGCGAGASVRESQQNPAGLG